MHDIDRTQRELASAIHEMQPEHFDYGGEMYGETYGETFESGEYGPHEYGANETGYEGEMYEALGENEMYEGGEFQESGEFGFESPSYESEFQEFGAHESPLHETEEMQLAAEFLEITNESELDQFLGKLMKRAWRGVRAAAPGLMRSVGGYLKPLAKAALPIAGRALGSFVGGPMGGAIGGKLASAAGNLFGLELEGMSGEDREYEVARRFVRFASTAARNAATLPPGGNPMAAARSAVAGAARRWAPGYLRRRDGGGGGYPYPGYDAQAGGNAVPGGSRRQGMWIRRGRRIILMGV